MKVPPSNRKHVKSGSTSWLIPHRPPHSHPYAREAGVDAAVARIVSDRFITGHFWLPLLLFAALSLAMMLAQGDLWIADRIYAWEGHRWLLKSAFLTQKIIHILGRDVSTMAWLGFLAAWLVANARDDLSLWRRPLAYLLVSVVLATALVAWVKSWSNMDCPWDLLRYGGDRPYVGLLALRPVGLSRGACFPAGHASAGYAWMALYFFFLGTRPRLRWIGLLIGLLAGAIFGFSQQLRGAHFLSHDVWAATICWMSALGLYLLPWMRPEISASAGADLAMARAE